MFNEFKKAKQIYSDLGGKTRLIIKISLISAISLILTAVYTHTATENPHYYELLKLSDALLEMAKTVTVTGFLATVISAYCEKRKSET